MLTPVKTRFCAASCECRYEHPDHIKKSHFSKNFIEKWDFFISVKPYNAEPFSIVITQKRIGKNGGISIHTQFKPYIRKVLKEKYLQLKSFNWHLWLALCLLALVPAIYQAIKTFLISTSNQNEVFHIIGQMEWFDLINETLQAFLIIPLYSVLNKIFKKQTDQFAGAVFKTGLIVFALYAVFSIGVFLYGKILIAAMNSDSIEINTVSRYLYLETAAFMIGIVVSFVNVVFVVTEKHRNVYLFLIIRILLSLIADFLLIPRLHIDGVALSNIVVNTVLAMFSISLLYTQKNLKFCRFQNSDFTLLREWCRIGAFSGLNQFLDNFIYAIMVCKMINMVEEQGNYWLANNFIWAWLLIPISALTEVIRSDCKNGYAKLKRFNYYFIACAVIAFWTLSIPTWQPFYRFVESLNNADEIFRLTIKLVPFYIAYAGYAIIDNIFIGLGKTVYNMVNSLIINFGYYGIFYVLTLSNTIDFDMNTIILMFGFGMVFHFIISIVEEKIFQRKNNIGLH